MIRRNPKADVYKLFQDEDSYGSALLVAAANVIPIEELSQMNVDSVIMDLQEEVQIRPSDLTIQKLHAAMSVLFEPDSFFEDLQGFIDICNFLAGEDIDMDVFDPADPFEMSWAIAEASFLHGEDMKEFEFDLDIRKYMGITLTQFGFSRPPFNMTMAIIREGVNPAMLLADQPDMVAASIQLQDEMSKQVNHSVRAQLEELALQVKPFLQEGSSAPDNNVESTGIFAGTPTRATGFPM